LWSAVISIPPEISFAVAGFASVSVSTKSPMR